MQRDLATVCDMIDAAERAVVRLEGKTYDDFRVDDTLQDAVVFRIVVIGEAASRVSESFRAQHPAIPWELARGMRNRIIHEYDRIHMQTVWDTVQQDLPPLLAQLRAIIAENPPE